MIIEVSAREAQTIRAIARKIETPRAKRESEFKRFVLERSHLESDAVAVELKKEGFYSSTTYVGDIAGRVRNFRALHQLREPTREGAAK